MPLFGKKKKQSGLSKLNTQATNDLKAYFAGQKPRLTYNNPSTSTQPGANSSANMPDYTPLPDYNYDNSSSYNTGGNFFLDMYANPQKYGEDLFSTQYLNDFYEAQKKIALGESAGYYDELAKYNKSQFDQSVGDVRRNLQEYLDRQTVQFNEDRTTQDVNAANKNTLFSSPRTNLRKKLQDSYNADINAKTSDAESAIATAARNYEYQNGSGALSGINFRVPTGSFNAMAPLPSVTTGNRRVYRPQGYVGNNVRERNAYAESLATQKVGVLRNNQAQLYAYPY